MTKSSLKNIKSRQHVSRRHFLIHFQIAFKHAISSVTLSHNTNTLFLFEVKRFDSIVCVKSTLLRRYLKTRFFQIWRVCITFLSTSVLPYTNFNSTSPMSATLVVWWSLKRIFLSLASLYFLKKLRSWQTWQDASVSSHQPLDPQITFNYVIIATKSSSTRFVYAVGWFSFLQFLTICTVLLHL